MDQNSKYTCHKTGSQQSLGLCQLLPILPCAGFSDTAQPACSLLAGRTLPPHPLALLLQALAGMLERHFQICGWLWIPEWILPTPRVDAGRGPTTPVRKEQGGWSAPVHQRMKMWADTTVTATDSKPSGASCWPSGVTQTQAYPSWNFLFWSLSFGNQDSFANKRGQK